MPKLSIASGRNLTFFGFDAGRPMIYTSGMDYKKEPDISKIGSEILKFGAASGPTRGNLYLNGTSLRRVSENMDFGYRLFNQIEVISQDTRHSRPFAERGDSGSLVFIIHRGDCSDLRAVGILEGSTSYGTFIMTPIWDVLKALKKHLRFKTFPMHAVQEASLSSSIADMSLQSEVRSAHLTGEKDRIEALRKELLEDADRRDQAKSQESAKHNLATQTRMDKIELKLDKQHEEHQRGLKHLEDLIKSLGKH